MDNHPQELVVVADDDDDIRMMVSESVRRLGYLVEEARDGLELCKKVAEHAQSDRCPTAVISDIGMPEQDGLTATQWITQMLPRVPVILVTGAHDERVWEMAAAAGARRILLKPFSSADLEGALERLRQLRAHIGQVHRA